MISTYQVYSDRVTTQLKGVATKHRLYRLADQWRKIKVDAAQWIVVYDVISHQGTLSLRKSIISESAMAMAIGRMRIRALRGGESIPFSRAPRRSCVIIGAAPTFGNVLDFPQRKRNKKARDKKKYN